MKALIIILAAFAASSAFARIGETEQEIQARYGKVLQSNLSTPAMPLRLYQTAEMSTGVIFINGRSAGEFISNKKKTELSEVQVQALLSANSDGGAWEEKLPLGAGMGMRRLESKARTAIYKTGQLIITTDECKEVTKKQTAAAQKETLKGF